MQHLKTLVPWAAQKNITQPLINKAKVAVNRNISLL